MDPTKVYLLTYAFTTFGVPLGTDFVNGLDLNKTTVTNGLTWLNRSYLSLMLLLLVFHRGDGFGKGAVSMTIFYYGHRAQETFTEKALKILPWQLRSAHTGMAWHDIRERKKLSNKDKMFFRQKQVEGIISHAASMIGIGIFLSSSTITKTVFGTFLTNYFFAPWAAAVFLWNFLSWLGHMVNYFATYFNVKFPQAMNKVETSLSIREFWIRWDVVVQKILQKYVYNPLLERKMRKDVAAPLTFFASGLLHIYPLYVAGLGNREALSMMSFFMLQYVLIGVETAMKIRKMDKFKRRAWTAAGVFLPAFLAFRPPVRLYFPTKY